jgi:hypothetical protein
MFYLVSMLLLQHSRVLQLHCCVPTGAPEPVLLLLLCASMERRILSPGLNLAVKLCFSMCTQHSGDRKPS